MNGKIDARGYLYIERSGTMKCQACPFEDRDGGQGACGDWCPLFGEPEPEQVSEGHFGHHIDICHGTTLTFSQFTDERPKP